MCSVGYFIGYYYLNRLRAGVKDIHGPDIWGIIEHRTKTRGFALLVTSEVYIMEVAISVALHINGVLI